MSLLLGREEIGPEGFIAPTGTLTFVARDAAPGMVLARLRIDGIESPVADRGATPPAFLDVGVTIT